MEFKKNQTIYLQIADFICEKIMTGKWVEGDKIASVRELASQIEVNPNTVMRSYTHLQNEEIIFNKRGIGFFINNGASDKIKKMEKEDFVNTILPEFFHKMQILNIDIKELNDLYSNYLKVHNS